ncbi:DH domain-containing protein [Plasmodiophora brassicae]|nr:hypothetical protein PBRA_003730 [Plasmodiophora brassicae]
MLDLAEDPSTAILSVEQTRAIFLDTSAILDVHGHLLERLSDALDTQRSTAQQVSLLCSIILDQKDALMRPYVTYMSQFGTSAQLLARLRQSNARFNSQLEEIRSQTGLELNSLMILPVQRLPRYELFLERLQKHAPGSRRVRNACQEFNAMVQQVDASMTLTSPLQELQWDRFDGRVNLVAPNRTLICVRDVRLVSETASFWHKRVSIIDVVGVLCNDVVVFAAPQTDRQLRFHSCMSLIGARVTDLVDDGDLVDAVRLETDRQMVTVLCNGPEDKQAWLNSIREALCTADNARRLGADTPQAVENAVALDLTA